MSQPSFRPQKGLFPIGPYIVSSFPTFLTSALMIKAIWSSEVSTEANFYTVPTPKSRLNINSCNKLFLALYLLHGSSYMLTRAILHYLNKNVYWETHMYWTVYIFFSLSNISQTGWLMFIVIHIGVCCFFIPSLLSLNPLYCPSKLYNTLTI